MKIREDEAPEMCRRRAWAGALYGFLGGSAFALLAGTIDTLLLRDLPIYTDWNTIFWRWAGFGLGLALVGAITGWITESAKGIAIGAAALSLAMLIYTLSQTTYSMVANATLFFVLVLPVSATCVPIAIALRLLLNRHWNEIEMGSKAPARRILVLSVLALILGMLPAFFTRSFGKAEISLRLMDTLLKSAAVGQVDTRFGMRLEQAPVLKTHIGMAYQLSQSTSIVSSEGYEINIIFADGFKATCTIVAYGDWKPYVNLCVDGRP